MKSKFNSCLSTFIWNEDLANRFVSDFKLPIPITSDKELFDYYLATYEDNYGTMSKYRFLEQTIDNGFGGDPNRFLKEYYDARENIIQSMLANPAYQKFNTMDLGKYALKDCDNVASNSIYNCGNSGKHFVSFDLKKANFQALKHVDPEIVFGCDSYEDFIGKFTDLGYVKQSKYTRNVIFGKLNPKRHITVEKYIINEARKRIEASRWFPNGEFTLASMNNDELVYEYKERYPLSYDCDRLKRDLEWVADDVRKELGFLLKADFFKLKGYCLSNKANGKAHKAFFVKDSLSYGKEEFTCVPLPFFPIVYKLYNGLEVLKNDRRILYEGCNAYLAGDFTIKKV